MFFHVTYFQEDETTLHKLVIINPLVINNRHQFPQLSERESPVQKGKDIERQGLSEEATLEQTKTKQNMQEK